MGMDGYSYSKEKQYRIEPWSRDILVTLKNILTGEYKDVVLPAGMILYGRYEQTTKDNKLCFFVDEVNNYVLFDPDYVYIQEMPWNPNA
jgi:hypothetical protein